MTLVKPKTIENREKSLNVLRHVFDVLVLDICRTALAAPDGGKYICPQCIGARIFSIVAIAPIFQHQ
jgi:hypothetical protein